MNIEYTRRGRNSYLNNNKNIVIWRRNYLRKLQDYGEANRPIYFTDDTWINAGHVRPKMWRDVNITFPRFAFLQGFSGEKGKRLSII